MSISRNIKMDLSGLDDFLEPGELEAMSGQVAAAAQELENGTCPGADYLGWLDLPARITEDELATIEATGARAREDAETYVVIGIGGSYLGARAVLESLGGSAAGCPEILFTGTGLCSASLERVLARVRDRDFRLCVISKSGTTLEPAVAFRLLRAELEKKYGRAGALCADWPRPKVTKPTLFPTTWADVFPCLRRWVWFPWPPRVWTSGAWSVEPGPRAMPAVSRN